MEDNAKLKSKRVSEWKSIRVEELKSKKLKSIRVEEWKRENSGTTFLFNSVTLEPCNSVTEKVE